MKRHIALYIQKLKKWLRLGLAKENERLRAVVSKLEKEKIDYEANLLRRYVKKGCEETLAHCEQLLESDEALKHFGKMWGEYKADTMMMLTSMEYEYISKYEFTDKELEVFRHVIGNIGLFFRGCKSAHDTKVALQNTEASK